MATDLSTVKTNPNPIHGTAHGHIGLQDFFSPNGSPKKCTACIQLTEKYVSHTKYPLWSLQGIVLQGKAHFLTERTRPLRFLLNVTGSRFSAQFSLTDYSVFSHCIQRTAKLEIMLAHEILTVELPHRGKTLFLTEYCTHKCVDPEGCAVFRRTRTILNSADHAPLA